MLKKIPLLLVIFLSLGAVVHKVYFLSLAVVNDAKEESRFVANNIALFIDDDDDGDDDKSFLGTMVEVVTRPFKRLRRLPSLKELLITFDTVFVKVSAMAVSFVNWITDRFKSYAQLADETHVQFKDVDVDVKELVQLTLKIERRCRSPNDDATRSLCVENQMTVHKKLLAARKQREQLRKRYETYQPYLSQG
jgi:hypothetical protein